jgi:hypothetical protein
MSSPRAEAGITYSVKDWVPPLPVGSGFSGEIVLKDGTADGPLAISDIESIAFTVRLAGNEYTFTDIQDLVIFNVYVSPTRIFLASNNQFGQWSLSTSPATLPDVSMSIQFVSFPLPPNINPPLGRITVDFDQSSFSFSTTGLPGPADVATRTAAVVPEPVSATLWLVGAACCLVTGAYRRFHRRHQPAAN